MKSRLASAFAAALLGSLAASAVRAASFVPMTDAALADQAAAIAVARVVAEIPAPDLDRPVTDYLVEIERQLKGDPLPSAIVVRVPHRVTARAESCAEMSRPTAAGITAIPACKGL